MEKIVTCLAAAGYNCFDKGKSLPGISILLVSHTVDHRECKAKDVVAQPHLKQFSDRDVPAAWVLRHTKNALRRGIVAAFRQGSARNQIIASGSEDAYLFRVTKPRHLPS